MQSTSTMADPTLNVLALGLRRPAAEHAPGSAWTELRDAAARQSRAGVPAMTWQLMFEGLELTAMAASAEHEGDDGGAALLVACASARISRARRTLPEQRRARHPIPRTAPVIVVGGPAHRVRRTSARLAGLILGASPGEPDLLRRSLETHGAALETWRLDLLARQRRARALRAA
jgi:hypothetical protein